MPAHYTLSGSQAGQIASRGRLLLRRRVITPFQHALLDAFLWGGRSPGSAMLIASLKDLARMAGQGRTTITEGITRLEELGLLQRIQRRVRVAWEAGAVASRVVANAYRLLVPDTESASRPAREKPQVIYPAVAPAPIAAVQEARNALAERRRTVEEMTRRTMAAGGSR